MRRNICILVCLVLLAVFVGRINAQFRLFGPRSTPQPMRKATELISRQPPLKVNQAVLQRATPDNTHIVVSLSKQRAYLMVGDQVAADGPISSGRRGRESPRGHFNVMEKDPNHHSSLYGDFVDGSGRVVRGGVSAQSDSAPSGTHFAGASMRWFLRLTSEGVGMHVGILPGYPASHGCIRQSTDGAKLFYDNVKVGTPVEVGE
ncbi:MAG TPA: L,D-transpeptidase family protein [Candidatus Udaeobacter sp.]|jgi:lipoprotein-anchoring transpeptidase ErfK/SrfK|nr:L,D-transpeptidase family protein [Candidatus Udaeobacter sp.]